MTFTRFGSRVNGEYSPAISGLGGGVVFRLREWLFDGITVMTVQDIAELLGALVAAWSSGWAGGYVIAKFKHAVNQTV